MNSRQSPALLNNNQQKERSFFKSFFTLFSFSSLASKNEKLKQLDVVIQKYDKHLEIARANEVINAKLDKKVSDSIKEADRVLDELYSARSLQKFL